MPDVKSLPAYYVLVVAGHGHAVSRDDEPPVRPTLSQRLRAFLAGLRPARPASVGRPRPV
jgi:hypothetical protein